jgi:predicted SnoaL-like aldol condensation-catalyzing enzyme
MEARNKALVLKAFDTLFNKRDYAAAERLWSPTYIQHSAHIAPESRELRFETNRFLDARDGIVSIVSNTAADSGAGH